MKRARRITVLLVIGAICMVTFLIPFLYALLQNAGLAEHDLALAEQEFSNSRAGLVADPDSDIFMSHGVTYGMRPAEVDAVLNGASEKSRELQQTTDESLRKRLYRFHYGPLYRDRLTGREGYLLTEDIMVIFDQNWRATEIAYLRFSNGVWKTKTVRIDLKNLPVERVDKTAP